MSKKEAAMKVYTKTGDKGTTSLVGGKRVMKTDLRIEAYGTLDELNSLVGLVRAYENDLIVEGTPVRPEEIAHFDEDLERVQRDLFVIGSRLACEDAEIMKQLPRLSSDSTGLLEQRMDFMSGQLKPLQHFILPGGSKIAAHLHIARTVCRRAERRVIELHGSAAVEEELIQYLNRLSDYFFVAARYANQLGRVNESEWGA